MVRGATQISQGTGGALDHFGRTALAYVDYRVVSITVLAVLAASIEAPSEPALSSPFAALAALKRDRESD